METVENEVWLLLEDGRLISMNHVAAPQFVAEGKAQLIPPERVVREAEGGPFTLLDEDDPRVAEGKAAAEKAAEEKAAAEAAAAEDADEDDDEEEVEEVEAPAEVESAATSPPEKAVTARASTRKPA